MRRIMSLIVIALSSPAIWGCNARGFDNTPVSNLQLWRYMGRWYEVARYDHRFERGLQYTKADYSMTKGGRVLVVNSGVDGNAFRKTDGIARTTDKPGLLKVSFFRPFWSDYRVLLLGPDYEYALVGSKSRKYLWILSRSPSLSDDAVSDILGEMFVRGYDQSKLIWVKQ